MAANRHCEICKAIIDPERAEVIPETKLCTEHAREIGKFGGEFTTRISHDKTSKAGSLKKNFGGVTTRKQRNVEAIRKLREQFEAAREAREQN